MAFLALVIALVLFVLAALGVPGRIHYGWAAMAVLALIAVATNLPPQLTS